MDAMLAADWTGVLKNRLGFRRNFEFTLLHHEVVDTEILKILKFF